MKTLFALTCLFAIPSFAGVYVSASSSQNALKLSGSIIGGFARAKGTYSDSAGTISIANPIMIDLLDERTKKKVSVLWMNEDDMEDGRLIAQRQGHKFEFCAVGVGSTLYQTVVGCYGVDAISQAPGSNP